VKKTTLKAPAPAPAVAPREIADDEQVKTPITRKEVEVLFNAARALELMREVEKKACDTQLAYFGVLLESVTSPALEVAGDLRLRFQDVAEKGGAR
jgi:hypothetical protein